MNSILILSYLLTGVRLVIYDWSTAPVHAKVYVIAQNYKFAFFMVLIWPYSVLTDMRNEFRVNRKGKALKFGMGVVVLFTGLFMWGGVFYFATQRFIGIGIINWVINVIAMFCIAPVMTVYLLPDPNPNKTIRDEMANLFPKGL